MNITFDIETVPDQRPGALEEYAAAVAAPATHKKPETIAAWLAEHRAAEAQSAWLKTSFDGGVGQVVCIGWAANDEPPTSLQVGDLTRHEEVEMLAEFFDAMALLYRNSGTKPVLIGHNHIAFDLPFLRKRCIVSQVKPCFWWPNAPKPWSDAVADTMLLWDATERKGASIDRICRLLGIPGKEGMSGADVWPAVQEGRIDDVAAYCRGDVERTRAMFKRMTFA